MNKIRLLLSVEENAISEKKNWNKTSLNDCEVICKDFFPL